MIFGFDFRCITLYFFDFSLNLNFKAVFGLLLSPILNILRVHYMVKGSIKCFVDICVDFEVAYFFELIIFDLDPHLKYICLTNLDYFSS